eukprot:12653878-Alexandrium_andersonii.AAC.1
MRIRRSVEVHGGPRRSGGGQWQQLEHALKQPPRQLETALARIWQAVSSVEGPWRVRGGSVEGPWR